jgi:hypothetical protein
MAINCQSSIYRDREKNSERWCSCMLDEALNCSNQEGWMATRIIYLEGCRSNSPYVIFSNGLGTSRVSRRGGNVTRYRLPTPKKSPRARWTRKPKTLWRPGVEHPTQPRCIG